MNFERGRPVSVVLGLGNLGRRDLYVEWPYLKTTRTEFYCLGNQYHIREIVDVLNNWYTREEKGISIFQFPATSGPGYDRFPPFVVTAAPGEETHYNSIYRKIDYDEILSRFFKVFNTEVRFKLWIHNTYENFGKFLRIVEVP